MNLMEDCETCSAYFRGHGIEALGDFKPLPRQLIPQNSKNWVYPIVEKLL